MVGDSAWLNYVRLKAVSAKSVNKLFRALMIFQNLVSQG